MMDVSGDGGTSVHVLELSQEVMGRQVPLFGVPPGDGDIQSPISQPTLQELEELAEKQFGAVDLMGGSGPPSNLASLDEPSSVHPSNFPLFRCKNMFDFMHSCLG